MGTQPLEVNGACSARTGSVKARTMATSSNSGRSRRGKPGATRQQIERSQRFERARRDSLRPEPDGRAVMYGWHTVTAALQNPARRIRMLLATRNAARRLNEEGVVSPVAPHIVQPTAIDERLAPDVVHQGLYLETDPLPSPAIEDLSAQGVVLVLDQITDPHNVGAIFRSAAAFGASAIVTTRRHSSDATGALAKVACGALEYVPLVNVQNLARALAALKQKGFLVIGLDSSGEADLASLPLRRPLALVLGAEGRGLRQLTKETCDYVACIHLPGEIRSLNVSNAAALALFIVNRFT